MEVVTTVCGLQEDGPTCSASGSLLAYTGGASGASGMGEGGSCAQV
jgi:hypothetical protein